MATTTSGLRYPISADDPDIPRDIRQLAEDVDNYLNATGGGAFNGVLPAIDINGNATTATRLATARTISLGGSLSGSASFDGSANVTITATNSASPTFTGTVTLPSTTSIGNVSSTEISYVDGVTSSIQTQLDGKQTIVSGVSDTEIGYLDGVTSAIQTQINSKIDKTYTIIAAKTGAYTLASGDESDLIELNGTFTLSIPTDATFNFAIGTVIDVLNIGTGVITIGAVNAGTTTVNGTPGLKLRAQWSASSIIKRASNTWVVIGDLVA